MWRGYWILGWMSSRPFLGSSEVQDPKSWLRGCCIYNIQSFSKLASIYLSHLSLWPHLILCVNGVHGVRLIQQFARISNIDCSLLFISCQNPKLDSSLPKCSDGVWNSFLESILNSSGSWKVQRCGSSVTANAWLLTFSKYYTAKQCLSNIFCVLVCAPRIQPWTR